MSVLLAIAFMYLRVTVVKNDRIGYTCYGNTFTSRWAMRNGFVYVSKSILFTTSLLFLEDA